MKRNELCKGFDPDEMTEVKEAQIDRDQGRSAIDVVYDRLIEKIELYDALIRDAKHDIKCWEMARAGLMELIEEIDKRK